MEKRDEQNKANKENERFSKIKETLFTGKAQWYSFKFFTNPQID